VLGTGVLVTGHPLRAEVFYTDIDYIRPGCCGQEMAAAAAVSWTPVRAGDAQAAAVLAEIDLYLAGRRVLFEWLNSVKAILGRTDGALYRYYEREFDVIRRQQIDKLPDKYALEYFNVAQGGWYYRTAYVERPEVPQSRVAMLSRVGSMLQRLKKLQTKIMKDERIPKGQARRRCIGNYQGFVIHLENWMIMAKKHVVPGVQALQRREEVGGRGFKRRAHMEKVQALLDELEMKA
jgi:hypothetical protein